MNQKHFMAHVPGNAFAEDVYATDTREARAKLRLRYGVSRLPSGVSVWEHQPIRDSANTTRRDSPYSAASGM